MLFNSLEYLLFLPIVFCLYWFVFNRSLRWQNILILIASYFFYGWWSLQFLGLLALSTLLDYLYGFGVASSNKSSSRFFLVLSVINNLGILAVFKYYNFFAAQIQSGLSLAGVHLSVTFLHLALPIGISFYTFHGMSYVFDIYRGYQKPIKNFVDYAVFVSFFPLLVAGPIERASHLLPQVQRKRMFDHDQAVDGFRLLTWGLFKKIVIADTLSMTVDKIFSNYHGYYAPSLIIGAIAFSFQIYCDFSGYSDIALGTAKLFGFELLSNFKFPYFSRDIAEFWRRWHISLSSWFRDYLYIPLGGSKAGKYKALRNTFIIFIVSGFWHGANWTFLAWGFLHALAFLPLLLMDRNRKNVSNVVAQDSKLPTFREVRQMVLTFSFVTVAWVFFRAPNIKTALGYISQICISAIKYPRQFLHIPSTAIVFVYILPLLLIDWWLRRNERSPRIKTGPIEMVICWVMVIVTMLYFQKESTFIYFQF